MGHPIRVGGAAQLVAWITYPRATRNTQVEDRPAYEGRPAIGALSRRDPRPVVTARSARQGAVRWVWPQRTADIRIVRRSWRRLDIRVR